MKYLWHTYLTIECGEIVQATVQQYNETLYNVQVGSSSCKAIFDEAELEEEMIYAGKLVASRQAWDKEEAVELARKEKEEEAFKQSTLGKFLATKTKLQAGKCKSTLERSLFINGKVYKRHEWCEVNYDKRTIDGVDALLNTDLDVYLTLTKTECDYIVYLQGKYKLIR